MRDGPRLDARDIRPELRPFRRRLAIVAFLERLVAIGAAALVVCDIAIIAAGPTIDRAAVWIAGAVLGSSLAAAAVALRSWRSWTATAAAVDHYLRLQDRAATALECLAASDAISPLVIADARVHLAAHEPREILLRSPLAARTITLGLSATLVILAVRFGSIERASSGTIVRHTGGAATNQLVAGTAPLGAPTPDQSKNGAPPTVEVNAAASARARTQQEAGTRQQAPAIARLTDLQGREDERVPSASQPAETTLASDTSGGNDGRGRGAPGSDPSRGQDTPGARGATDRGVTTSAASSSESARAGAGAGPGGAITTPAAGSRGAGGVQGAAVARPSATASTAAVDRGTYMLEYRTALRTAESAVGQERVPDRLRRYVHDYFIAIHPDGDRGGQR